ncbi:hypothetical protein AXF42_Ash004757 [Apostasia shenzhenica]|uniref:Uncharacterized protein n=1 Tax=Apostasia shenzhenica TaxID=1088818 RepID=A0A2I0BHL4_9ASPA|nr:hypothetical protein AXF42_Ash004757 [Apostasia shenzhenica]
MPTQAFIGLRDMLVDRGVLRDTRFMPPAEQLAIFMRVIAQTDSYRSVCEFFQYSLETVSQNFRQVLQGVLALRDDFIVLPNVSSPYHPHIRNNSHFYPYFNFRNRVHRRYESPQELYNHRHAQLRNIVERTFGILKKRFKVLTDIKPFPFSIQADIVLACCILHNYIGRNHGHDTYFNMHEADTEHDEILDDDAEDDDPTTHISTSEQRR